MPAATNPPTPSAPAATSSINHSTLPPPATFDFLPPLQALLARLILPQSGAISANSPQSSQSDQPLSPKDLATAASAITAKIQKAWAAVRSMEGVDMGLEEQEDIIRELEAEVARGKSVLNSLRESCAGVAEGGREMDGKMEGVKEEEERDVLAAKA